MKYSMILSEINKERKLAEIMLEYNGTPVNVQIIKILIAHVSLNLFL